MPYPEHTPRRRPVPATAPRPDARAPDDLAVPAGAEVPALRLTWVQPEDLVGHELRQAELDGRDATALRERWLAAGGTLAPDRAGASPRPAEPGVRALAVEVLDALAALPAPLADREPDELPAIRAACPHWPTGGRVPESVLDPVTGGSRASTGDVPEMPREGTSPDDAAGAAGVPPLAVGEPVPGRPAAGSALRERLHAAWLGRAVGCLLGKPVEKLPLEGVRALARATGNWPLETWFTAVGLDRATAERWPWNRRSAGTSLAENIDGMPEDDDLNYPVLALLLLRRFGPDFHTGQVAQLWLDELPAGRTFTAERVAYRNLLSGVEPPHTAHHHNPFREWIGAQIRADVLGWTRPGDPAAAAEAAYRDATLTHTGNGVYGEMFVAAALAAAAGGTAGVRACLAAGLSVVPADSRYAHAVRYGVELASAEPTGTVEGFASVVDHLHAAYRDHHWVHVLPNAALLAAALVHADGDFTGSICRVVSGGWDTDSNGATAGSLAGLLAGSPGALPERWTRPLRNRLATSVGGLDGVGFDVLAEWTADLAVSPSTDPTGGGAGGSTEVFDPTTRAPRGAPSSAGRHRAPASDRQESPHS